MSQLDGGDLTQIKEMIKDILKNELSVRIKLNKTESLGMEAEIKVFLNDEQIDSSDDSIVWEYYD